MKNQMSIIRTEKAGVFFAEVKSRKGQEAVLANCRRLWYWNGAASLSQLAVDGVSKPNDCKFTVTVPEMEVFGVIEIIPASDKAIQSINSVPVWKN